MIKFGRVVLGLLFLSALFMTSCDDSSEVGKGVDKQLLLSLVNEVRASGYTCGSTAYPPVPAVSWNDQLAKAAQDHSNDMDKNQELTHTGSNGSSVGDRIERAGYQWSAYNENIAVGYETEADVIQGWLSSSGHCRNIMSASVTEMGVAATGNYWTQVFAKPQ